MKWPNACPWCHTEVKIYTQPCFCEHKTFKNRLSQYFYFMYKSIAFIQYDKYLILMYDQANYQFSKLDSVHLDFSSVETLEKQLDLILTFQ